MNDAGGIEVGMVEGPEPREARRVLPWVAGAVATLLVVGGGVVAAQWYFGDGPQPADALPASTIVYASVNLDPSGEQQLAARELLEDFPIWEEADVDSDDDIRQWLFETMREQADCDGLDYEDDVASWLGDRLAFAAVPVGEKGTAEPVIVVQTSNEDDTADALEKVRACADPESVEWDFSDGWVIVAEKQEVLDAVIDGAADGTLADDDTYRDLVDAAGGPGLITSYMAPDFFESFAEDLSAEEEIPPGALDMLGESFEGMAGTVRVEDDALEIHSVGSFGGEFFAVGDADAGGAEILGEAPADASLVYALSTSPGWARDMLDLLRTANGAEAREMNEVLRMLEEQLGEKPAKFAEKLLGEGGFLVIGAEPAEIALRIEGGGAKAEEAWARLRSVVADPTAASMMEVSREGGTVVVGPTESYREEVLDPAETLADRGRMDAVLPDLEEAHGALYVDFDSAFLDYVLASAPPEVRDNIEPLDQAGMNGWYEDGLVHTRFRITVD